MNECKGRGTSRPRDSCSSCVRWARAWPSLGVSSPLQLKVWVQVKVTDFLSKHGLTEDSKRTARWYTWAGRAGVPICRVRCLWKASQEGATQKNLCKGSRSSGITGAFSPLLSVLLVSEPHLGYLEPLPALSSGLALWGSQENLCCQTGSCMYRCHSSSSHISNPILILKIYLLWIL